MKHLKEGLQNFLCTDFLWYITWCCILYAQKHRFFFMLCSPGFIHYKVLKAQHSSVAPLGD